MQFVVTPNLKNVLTVYDQQNLIHSQLSRPDYGITFILELTHHNRPFIIMCEGSKKSALIRSSLYLYYGNIDQQTSDLLLTARC